MKQHIICGVRWSTNQYPEKSFIDLDIQDCPATKMYRNEEIISRGHMGDTKVISYIYTCKNPFNQEIEIQFYDTDKGKDNV